MSNWWRKGISKVDKGAGYEVCVVEAPEIDEVPAPTEGWIVFHPKIRLMVFCRAILICGYFLIGPGPRRLRALARQRPEDLLVSQSIQGYPALRRAISDHVREWRGVIAAPEQIFVTAGIKSKLLSYACGS